VGTRGPRILLTLGLAALVATVAAGAATGSSQRRSSVPDAEETEQVVSAPNAASAACGVERWSVKTGSDADKALINLSSTSSTTIAALGALPAPSTLPSDNRVQPTETTVFKIAATLNEYKLEADSDYHLVLNDSSGHTMIAEIPDPACVAAGSVLTSQIQHSRAQFDAKYTVTGSFKTANAPVTITGVGFFDFLHGQTGVAPNGIELHAVTDIQFSGGTTGSVTVTNPGSQTATVGTPASLQISATDTATGTLSYTATGLPTGLTVNTATGLISGTPTTAGTYTATATATDSTGPSGTTSFTWTVNPASGGTCTPAQLLANPGFETGTPAPWTASTGVISNNTSEPAHTGSWDAWLDGYGTTTTDTLAQTLTLPTGCTGYQLGFWLHTDTAETSTTTAYDTLKVQILDNSGTVLTTLATYSNLNHNTGYTQHTFNLNTYAGQAITLKFTGTEDFTAQTSFVLDDTAITLS
jgi:hypothetical protein